MHRTTKGRRTREGDEMDFNWWEGLVAGALATLAMTALMQMGAAKGMTRMNMAVMLGSMFRRDPGSARSLG
jgi:hypothetical protein